MSSIEQIGDSLLGESSPTVDDTWELLRQRVTVLSDRVWEGKNKWPDVQAWLNNFDGRSGETVEVEQLHALFILSQFLYIGSVETRVLLRSLYRDLFLLPLIQEVRREYSSTRNVDVVKQGVHSALLRTRFLGVGNPSESGVHLLYYFRQENRLSKDLFLDSAAMFKTAVDASGNLQRVIANSHIDRYVFVDDVCGSGDTADVYSRNILTELATLKPDAKLYYFSMFASADGMERVRSKTKFGQNCGAVFELDGTYKCLEKNSRILHAAPAHVNGDILRKVALTYGKVLLPEHPGGFDGNQFLLGFHHNTPDNTLPIIWFEGTDRSTWTPAFKRYPKF